MVHKKEILRSKMRQAKVGQIVLSDKIYIKKDQVYDEDELSIFIHL